MELYSSHEIKIRLQIWSFHLLSSSSCHFVYNFFEISIIPYRLSTSRFIDQVIRSIGTYVAAKNDNDIIEQLKKYVNHQSLHFRVIQGVTSSKARKDMKNISTIKPPPSFLLIIQYYVSSYTLTFGNRNKT